LLDTGCGFIGRDDKDKKLFLEKPHLHFSIRSD